MLDNGYINDQLQYIELNIESIEEDVKENQEEDDGIEIMRTFVPITPLSSREDCAIKNTLGRMQKKERLVDWPQINNIPINEFQTPGYIVCIFPTLYLTGNADLCAERIKNVKPAEYFKYLLQYKDGRFEWHSR